MKCTKFFFDIIVITETIITKNKCLLDNVDLNNYSFEFTPAETFAGHTLLYIVIIYHINVIMTYISI